MILLVPFLIAVALLVCLYFLFKLLISVALWHKDNALEKMFWQVGEMIDGKRRIKVSINMGMPRGCFYQVRIHSLFHILRRWFLGKGFKKTVMCHYRHLCADAILTDPKGVIENLQRP